jgi:ribosomal protein S12 methylthiotransferase accessory factor
MCVFMGVALQDNASDGPSAAVGLGAAIDPVAAARKAAIEVGQVRPSIRRRARLIDPDRVKELAANPLKVKTMEDHALLYAHPSTIHEFDFLFGDLQKWAKQEPTESAQNLWTILHHFREVDQDVLYVNLTPPDMKKLGICTVRAIVPSYQPIWFGRGERRLGGRRLFEFPIIQGLLDAVPDPAVLNPMPHPIA